MVQVTMDLKMHMYVEIVLERQPQKLNKKKKRKILQSLIQDAQENSRQYLPT